MKPVLSPYAWPPVPRRTIPNDIGTAGKSPLPASMIPPAGGGTQPASAEPAPIATYAPGQYGQAVTVPIIFAGAGALLALAKPSTGIRKLLVINNTIAGFTITIGFDAPPTVASGMQIVAGGNLFLDVAVPQNDIWIFSPAAGTVQLVFMNDNQ